MDAGRYRGLTSILPRYKGNIEMELFLGQQNLVLLEGLKSALLGGAGLSTATTTVALVTLSGTTLANATLAYVSGTVGRYEGTLPVVSSLVEGTEYLAHIKVLSAATTVAFWKFRATAIERRE